MFHHLVFFFRWTTFIFTVFYVCSVYLACSFFSLFLSFLDTSSFFLLFFIFKIVFLFLLTTKEKKRKTGVGQKQKKSNTEQHTALHSVGKR